MFPSFTSVSNRNSKRQQLLDRIRDDQAVTAKKREAYANTLWADDREKNRIDLAKAMNPDPAEVGRVYELMGEASSGLPTLPPLPPAAPQVLVNESPADIYAAMAGDDIGDEDESMSDIDDVEFFDALEELAIRPRLGMFEESDEEEKSDDVVFQETEGFFQAGVETLYDTHPSLATKRISPIDKEGDLMSNYYIDHDGYIRAKSNAELLDNPINHIDWRLTYLYVKGKIMHNKYAAKSTSQGETKRKIFNALKWMRTKKQTASVETGIAKPSFKGLTVKSTKPVDRVKQEARKSVIGRGLRGGAITCKNLAKIEGTGTASDLKYKRMGSKFIRVADLKKNRLKLVFPNRTSVGPIRDISSELALCINKLVFEKDINQQMYEKLNVSDKQFFQTILKLTHLQHQFSDDLKNPIEELQAEFDKLRSQVMMGNDNPQLIKELKALSIDLYGQKLISENEFREIMITI